MIGGAGDLSTHGRRTNVLNWRFALSATLTGREQPVPHRTYAAVRDERRILVATDATINARGAIVMGSLLAEEGATTVRALSVVDPFFVGIPELGAAPPPIDLEQSRVDARSATVGEAITHTLGSSTHWPVDVRMGLSGQVIAATAEEQGASLVVLGLGRHRLSDRLLGRETALQVTRFGSTPVLAVPAEGAVLPQVAVVATDFSDYSLRAARTALALFPSLTWLYLVHVRPLASPPVAPDELVELKLFRKALPLAAGTQVQSVVLPGGDAAESLLRFAGLARANLIVAGTHGRGFFARLVHGSVSTNVIRGAECAVLVVPPPRADSSAVAAQIVPLSKPGTAWTTVLTEFSARNAGRKCALEMDDPAAGAQLRATGFTFLGATFAADEGRIELLLGVAVPRLTRHIVGVVGVDVVSGGNGRETLRVAHGSGHTLLTVL